MRSGEAHEGEPREGHRRVHGKSYETFGDAARAPSERQTIVFRRLSAGASEQEIRA
jgi:hypothetical protein